MEGIDELWQGGLIENGLIEDVILTHPWTMDFELNPWGWACFGGCCVVGTITDALPDA